MKPSIMSSQSQRYLQKTVNMVAKFGGVPFQLNSDLNLLERRGKLPTLTRKINTVNIFVLPAYLMGRFAHVMLFRDPTNSKATRSSMVIMFVLIMLLHGATTMLHLASNHEAHFGFVQMTITFFRTKKGPCKNNGTRTGCERYLQGFLIGMRLTLVGAIGVLLFKPHRVHTFMSIFSEPHKQPFFFPVTLANYSFIILCVVISHYAVVIPIVYIFTMYTKINMLKRAINSRCATYSVQFAHSYRSAQLLQRYFNTLFGTWLLPIHQNLSIAGSVMGIYGLERITGPIRGVWGVLMLLHIFHLSFAYNKMGQLHEESRELLKVAEVVLRNNEKWMRRFLASCKPIAVTHGSMFFVDKSLVLTIWSTVACSAINLLVTLP